jgi:hypothetical protein
MFGHQDAALEKFYPQPAPVLPDECDPATHRWQAIGRSPLMSYVLVVNARRVRGCVLSSACGNLAKNADNSDLRLAQLASVLTPMKGRAAFVLRRVIAGTRTREEIIASVCAHVSTGGNFPEQTKYPIKPD